MAALTEKELYDRYDKLVEKMLNNGIGLGKTPTNIPGRGLAQQVVSPYSNNSGALTQANLNQTFANLQAAQNNTWVGNNWWVKGGGQVIQDPEVKPEKTRQIGVIIREINNLLYTIKRMREGV